MALVRCLAPLAVALAVVTFAGGCSTDSPPSRDLSSTATTTSTPASPTPASPTIPASPTPASETSASEAAEPAPTSATPSSAEPRRSFLTIPRLGLRDYPVIRYRGSPDDAAGTLLQNDGSLASPRGAGGGGAPGEIGNYIVTGHRLSSTQPFRYLPSIPDGSRVLVRVDDVEHVYEVRRTRWTSFRSPTSLTAQRAPVPGRPGVEPTRPMITLSTCATIEDHAAGNFWADQFDNPEHRIDKIGVLIATRRVAADNTLSR